MKYSRFTGSFVCVMGIAWGVLGFYTSQDAVVDCTNDESVCAINVSGGYWSKCEVENSCPNDCIPTEGYYDPQLGIVATQIGVAGCTAHGTYKTCGPKRILLNWSSCSNENSACGKRQIPSILEYKDGVVQGGELL